MGAGMEPENNIAVTIQPKLVRSANQLRQQRGLWLRSKLYALQLFGLFSTDQRATVRGACAQNLSTWSLYDFGSSGRPAASTLPSKGQSGYIRATNPLSSIQSIHEFPPIWKMNTTTRTTLIAIGIPTIYAIVLRIFFGFDDWNDIFSVMSVTFWLFYRF